VMKMADRLVKIEDGEISMLAVKIKKKWSRVRERSLSSPDRSRAQIEDDK
jgi:hypothetical protein